MLHTAWCTFFFTACPINFFLVRGICDVPAKWACSQSQSLICIPKLSLIKCQDILVIPFRLSNHHMEFQNKIILTISNYIELVFFSCATSRFLFYLVMIIASVQCSLWTRLCTWWTWIDIAESATKSIYHYSLLLDLSLILKHVCVHVSVWTVRTGSSLARRQSALKNRYSQHAFRIRFPDWRSYNFTLTKRMLSFVFEYIYIYVYSIAPQSLMASSYTQNAIYKYRKTRSMKRISIVLLVRW